MDRYTNPKGDMDWVSFLQSTPLFSGLADSTVRSVTQDCRTINIAKGDYLFFEGDDALSAYVVVRGWIVILLTSSDGRELVLSEMRPGDLFGENAIITGARRSATAVARENTVLLELSGRRFVQAVDGDPRLARCLLETAAERISAGNARESALAFLDAGARVARVLRTLDDMDRATADKGYVTVSQDEIAQRTGLARQTVARFLGRWRRNGWLVTGRGRIMLLNRAAIFALEGQSED